MILLHLLGMGMLKAIYRWSKIWSTIKESFLPHYQHDKLHVLVGQTYSMFIHVPLLQFYWLKTLFFSSSDKWSTFIIVNQGSMIPQSSTHLNIRPLLKSLYDLTITIMLWNILYLHVFGGPSQFHLQYYNNHIL